MSRIVEQTARLDMFGHDSAGVQNSVTFGALTPKIPQMLKAFFGVKEDGTPEVNTDEEANFRALLKKMMVDILSEQSVADSLLVTQKTAAAPAASGSQAPQDLSLPKDISKENLKDSRELVTAMRLCEGYLPTASADLEQELWLSQAGHYLQRSTSFMGGTLNDLPCMALSQNVSVQPSNLARLFASKLRDLASREIHSFTEWSSWNARILACLSEIAVPAHELYQNRVASILRSGSFGTFEESRSNYVATLHRLPAGSMSPVFSAHLFVHITNSRDSKLGWRWGRLPEAVEAISRSGHSEVGNILGELSRFTEARAASRTVSAMDKPRGEFKGYCNACDQWGHMVRDCRGPPAGKRTRQVHLLVDTGAEVSVMARSALSLYSDVKILPLKKPLILRAFSGEEHAATEVALVRLPGLHHRVKFYLTEIELTHTLLGQDVLERCEVRKNCLSCPDGQIPLDRWKVIAQPHPPHPTPTRPSLSLQGRRRMPGGSLPAVLGQQAVVAAVEARAGAGAGAGAEAGEAGVQAEAVATRPGGARNPTTPAAGVPPASPVECARPRPTKLPTMRKMRLAGQETSPTTSDQVSQPSLSLPSPSSRPPFGGREKGKERAEEVVVSLVEEVVFEVPYQLAPAAEVAAVAAVCCSSSKGPGKGPSSSSCSCSSSPGRSSSSIGYVGVPPGVIPKSNLKAATLNPEVPKLGTNGRVCFGEVQTRLFEPVPTKSDTRGTKPTIKIMGEALHFTIENTKDAKKFHVHIAKHMAGHEVHLNSKAKELVREVRQQCQACRMHADAPKVHRKTRGVQKQPGQVYEVDHMFLKGHGDRPILILTDRATGTTGITPCNTKEPKLADVVHLCETHLGGPPTLYFTSDQGYQVDTQTAYGVPWYTKGTRGHCHQVEGRVKTAKRLYLRNIADPPAELAALLKSYSTHSKEVWSWVASQMNRLPKHEKKKSPSQELAEYREGTKHPVHINIQKVDRQARKPPAQKLYTPEVGDVVDLHIDKSTWDLNWEVTKVIPESSSVQVSKSGKRDRLAADTLCRLVSRANKGTKPEHTPTTRVDIQQKPTTQLDKGKSRWEEVLDEMEDMDTAGYTPAAPRPLAQPSATPAIESGAVQHNVAHTPGKGDRPSPSTVQYYTPQGSGGSPGVHIHIYNPQQEQLREPNLEIPQGAQYTQTPPQQPTPSVTPQSTPGSGGGSPARPDWWHQVYRTASPRVGVALEVEEEVVTPPAPPTPDREPLTQPSPIVTPQVQKRAPTPKGKTRRAIKKLASKVYGEAPSGLDRHNRVKKAPQRYNQCTVEQESETAPQPSSSQNQKKYRRTAADLLKIHESCPRLKSLGLHPKLVSPNSKLSYMELEQLITTDEKKYEEVYQNMKVELGDYDGATTDTSPAELERHRGPIPNVGWVFLLKPDGSIRCRLCIRECWRTGEDCSCAGVNRDSWRIGLSAYLQQKKEGQDVARCVIDLKKAFLDSKSDVADRVWKYRKKYVVYNGVIRRVLTGIYGLKTGPRIFKESLHISFETVGWDSGYDPSTYTNKDKTARAICCMDDLDVSGNTAAVKELVASLEKDWPRGVKTQWTKLGETTTFAGVKTTERENHTIELSILKEETMEWPQNPSHGSLHTLMGQQLWVGVCTPKIHALAEATKIAKAALLAEPPRLEEVEASRQQYRRWKKHYDKEGSVVIIGALDPTSELLVFSDASFDQQKCRSKGCGIAFGLNSEGQPSYVGSFARGNHRVVQSPLGAELCATIENLDFIEHLQSTAMQLGLFFAVKTIAVDNDSIITHVTKNHSKTQRGLITKAYMYIKRKKEDLEVDLGWIPGPENPADVGTKPSPALVSWENLTTLLQGQWPSMRITTYTSA